MCVESYATRAMRSGKYIAEKVFPPRINHLNYKHTKGDITSKFIQLFKDKKVQITKRAKKIENDIGETFFLNN